MKNWYVGFKRWSAAQKRPDVVRAIVGIAIVFSIIWLLTGCMAPSMTLSSSHRGDGFIQLTQPIYQSSGCSPKHEVFVDYLHHSEIFKETDEDVFDGGRLGYTYQFGNWLWDD